MIGFGTIDDIDQVAGRRGDRQSSAGQQEVTAVFMQAFAGAGTVVRGNCTFGMFSNFPENVDDALRQRAGARFLVDGPKTREDYIDILALLLGRNHRIPLGDHELFAAQEIRRAVAASFESHGVPHEAGLRAVWERVTREVGPLDTLARLGTYLKAIQEADPRFTGRAVKNITDAVKVRAMDFELPDEWMEKPELFLFRPYEDKRAMIRELMRPITVEMVVQEINRYADSEFRYADTSDARAIDAMVRDMKRAEAAKRRYLEGAGVMEPVGWTNSVLPLAALVGLAAALPGVLTPRGTLSQARLAAGVAATAVLVLAAGAGLFAALYARAGADPRGAFAAAPAATAGFFLARSAAAGLVWLPVLALVWLIRAQGVERRRGEAMAREGRG